MLVTPPAADLHSVPLAELVPLGPDLLPGRPSVASVYRAVNRGEVPVVKLRGRMWSHPSWVAQRAARLVGPDGIEVVPTPASGRRLSRLEAALGGERRKGGSV